MENVQLLNDSQIREIWYIIRRDYVDLLINKKFNELKTKEDYIQIYNSMTKTKEYKDKLDIIENKYQSNLKALVLIKELKELDHNAFDRTFYGWSIDSITETYNNSISSLKIEIEEIALDKLNIQNRHVIYNNIEMDIKVVLSLTSVSDLNTIIENTVKYINVDKYLYK